MAPLVLGTSKDSLRVYNTAGFMGTPPAAGGIDRPQQASGVCRKSFTLPATVIVMNSDMSLDDLKESVMGLISEFSSGRRASGAFGDAPPYDPDSLDEYSEDSEDSEKEEALQAKRDQWACSLVGDRLTAAGLTAAQA